ncbi:protein DETOXIFICATION 12-like [Andrographis paniculata]|uniref:protein DETOXIFICATION 12-like n=1 Tax=Andrographis paniculata TaxID=175694 RepID=UPI0021E7DDD8|nr:protein DETOXIFICATION 12-like [Andrographis paniculata]XP_051148799.1 protein DETOXIFICATION 12-like [Andrographis paniculata]XP_051148800.1 protein DETOXIFICATION 12-like [Andrographis paniculata]
MDESLLAKEKLPDEEGRSVWPEIKRLGFLAGPLVVVTSLQFVLQIISLMMVGHLGELQLAGASLATSLAGVTGFSFMLGLASALETLSGQAYGAKQYEKVGTQTHTAVLSLIIVCIPLSVLWLFTGKLFAVIGQDPAISAEAGRYIIWLIPALFGYAALQPLIRYYQTQSMILPIVASSCFSIVFHVIICWLVVYRTAMGSVGGAASMGLSVWLNVVALVAYMKWSPACAKTRAPISMKVLDGMGEFFKFAVPSAVMICLEWWSYELLILLSGLLPNPQLETSVLSVCLNTISTLYAIPSGLAAAGSTRISNELGAGNPQGARTAVIALMLFAGMNAVVVSTSLFATRNIFGYIFSNEKEVVSYVTKMAPLVSLSVIVDNTQGTLSGVARGCGWQHIGAYINLGAFYLFGIPIAVALSFWLDLRGRGLWIGVLAGATIQSILFGVITCCTNWEKQAIGARQRLLAEESATLASEERVV